MSRDKRLSKLGTIPAHGRVDHRFFLDANGKDRRLAKLPRNKRRALAADAKKLAAKYNQILLSLSQSGVGYPVDKLLRELAVEYTHRYASSGVATQPVNFNYFESFCSINLIEGSFAPYAIPVPELDHLFSVADYFDYITDQDAPKFSLEELKQLPEGVAHHFTQNGSINDFTYMTSEGREFLVSGFSMVRRGSSLHWYVIGGEVLPEEEWRSGRYDHKVDLKDIPPEKRLFLGQSITRDGGKTGEPIALEGTKNAIRTIIAGETDLISGKHVGRCHMAETKHSFQLVCDDPDIFDGLRDAERKEQFVANMKQRVESAAVMWNLAEAFFQLPSYFKHRLTVSQETIDKSGKPAPKTARGGRGIRATFSHVTSIEISDVKPSVVRSYTAPHLEVDTAGHWRRLSSDDYGEDPRGNKVKGRTWIKADNKWRARSDDARPVYIKSSLAAAKVQIADYIQAAQHADAIPQKTNAEQGVLYIMRCLAMQDEVYKVGWTSNTAEQRARELSSATGVPSSFAVVDSWKHADPEALEKGVHAKLAPYRLNNSREFFKLDYPELKSIIDGEINRSKREN